MVLTQVDNFFKTGAQTAAVLVCIGSGVRRSRSAGEGLGDSGDALLTRGGWA